MQDVWVLANVFETDIQKIKAGQPAEVTTLAYPGKIFYGKVDQVNSVLDPMSKAMKIKIVLPNTDMLLKPEMFTSIMLAKAESQKALEIPSDCNNLRRRQKLCSYVYKDRYHVKAQEVNILKSFRHKNLYNGGRKRR